MIEKYINDNLFKNPNALVAVSTLLGHFKVWAMRNGHARLTRTEFVEALEALGYVIGRRHDTAAVIGLSFSNESRYKVDDDGVIRKNPAYPAAATR